MSNQSINEVILSIYKCVTQSQCAGVSLQFNLNTDQSGVLKQHSNQQPRHSLDPNLDQNKN